MKLKSAYFDAVRAWDKKIRLVGKTPIEQLYNESLKALRTLETKAKVLVDVGAGNGILGFPWLELSPEHKCIFLEPDPKKAAFILDFASRSHNGLSVADRSMVLCQKLENVPRETILKYSANSFCLATRAFSGAIGLKEAFAKSELKDQEFFVFDLVNGRACFRKLV